jgi:quercetin dioxygenase-like cupin family protein
LGAACGPHPPTHRENNVRNTKSLIAASTGAVFLASSIAFAADMAMSSSYTSAKDVKWGDAPPTLPKGAKMAVLMGDPGKSGPFVARLQVPASYKIPPHWHSTDEDLTVISGTFYFAEGEKMDTKGGHAMKAGSFHHLPAKTKHYAWSKGPAVVQINATGPFDIVYVNDKDDPSKMADMKPAMKDEKKAMKK